MSISNTITLATQEGKYFCIYQDKLSSQFNYTKEDKLVWFVFVEAQDKGKKAWSGWVSQWNYLDHCKTREEAFERVKLEKKENGR